MKISSPVTCEKIIRPKLQFKNIEYWCIAMNFDYEFQGCRPVCFSGNSRSELKPFINFCSQPSIEKIICIRSSLNKKIVPTTSDFIDFFRAQKVTNFMDIELCDYILLSKISYLSLVDRKFFHTKKN